MLVPANRPRRWPRTNNVCLGGLRVSLCGPLIKADQGPLCGSSGLENKGKQGQCTDVRVLGGSRRKGEGFTRIPESNRRRFPATMRNPPMHPMSGICQLMSASWESDFGIATRTFMRARVRTAKFRPFLCVTATETMHVADESPCEGGRMVKPYQLHVLATMGSLW